MYCKTMQENECSRTSQNTLFIDKCTGVVLFQPCYRSPRERMAKDPLTEMGRFAYRETFREISLTDLCSPRVYLSSGTI